MPRAVARGGVVVNTSSTEKEQARVHIRWMIRRDMPEVLQTEQQSFEYPWTEEDFLRCLRQRNCIGMVAEQGEKVVGFMIYELPKAKLHILNFAVHPGWRRCAGPWADPTPAPPAAVSVLFAFRAHSISCRPSRRKACCGRET